MEKIDFVLPWVDVNDPAWLAEKGKWDGSDTAKSDASDANSECRYRDNGMLRYWFRAVEKFAPWVNRIHFVTCGQKPEWLNEAHPKLHLVNHEDYIPKEYLPTFCARTIAMNYHRIEGLSEHFVMFDDDILLVRPIEPSFFFKQGEPVLLAKLQYHKTVGYNNWSRVLFNDYCIVNSSFNIPKSIWENRKKWFSVKELGYKKARRNLMCYLANKTLPVSTYAHVSQPHLKSTMQELWERYPEVLHQSSMQKFRTDDQVNPWLLCAWNQAKGTFYPATVDTLGRNISICPERLDDICGFIETQAVSQICVNDSPLNTEPERCHREIAKSFESILPEKSLFEKV